MEAREEADQVRPIMLFGVKMRPNYIEPPHHHRRRDNESEMKPSQEKKPNDNDGLNHVHGVDEFAASGSESRNLKFHAAVVPVYNPVPLGFFHPCYTLAPFHIDHHHQVNGLEISATDRSIIPTSDGNPPQIMKNKKRKKNVGTTDDDHGRKKKKRIIDQDESIPSATDIPGLVEIIKSQDGTTEPVFLYGKKLEDSDMVTQQNRLMINRNLKLMEFLTEEERSSLMDMDSKKGLKFSGIDSMGRVYDELNLKYWPSLKKIIINSKGWNKMLRDNNIHVKKSDENNEKDYWVQVWGYRQGGELRLAFNFRESEAVKEAESSDFASSSGSIATV